VIAQAPRVKLFGKLPKPTFDFLTFEEGVTNTDGGRR